MNRPTSAFTRRIASTFFVLLALFLVCAGVQAMPCPSTMVPADSQHAALVALDDAPDIDDQDAVPSIEDNTSGLDDTFDVPAEHAVAVPRPMPVRPPAHAADSHAHVHNAELRPPIA